MLQEARHPPASAGSLCPAKFLERKNSELGLKKSRFVYLPHGEATLISHVTLRSIAVSCHQLNKFGFYFSGQRRVSQWTSHVTAAESLKSQPGLLEKNSVLCIVVFVKLILSLTYTPSYTCASC